MVILYITLNNDDEARKVGYKLLEMNLANCVNFFPITCIYNYKGKLEEEGETVLIVKTKKSKFEEIEKVIKSVIDYDNFIGQFVVTKVNDSFSRWIDQVVKE
ncbi:MAG: divalent-cation tolerance protein CutA [Candidatus Dojkabacteria bacterium]|jgi:periplasmic divalent cation tolerance protein|nr:divalent-cation tolerance protein CutA [Candidatus Dojkabacteria bacterium]